MKKQVISTMCLSAFLISGVAYAGTVSKSFGGFNINLNTPDVETKTTTTTTNSNRAKEISANQTAMKKQINKILASSNASTATYEKSVNSLVNTLMPAKNASVINAEKAKLKKNAKDAMTVNIDIAENGAIQLTNYLNTSATKNSYKNLSSSKKATVKSNLNSLYSVKSNYVSIIGESKTLAKQVQNDPTAAILMASEFNKLKQVQKELPKQVKTITTLTKAVTKTTGLK
ncbi:MAG: hypothetical protein ACI4SM_05800 [Candidatus Gastranaerophilaceae bacterium]